MSKVSVVIPARNEQFLQPTINELLSKAHGDIEVIAILDGYWPDPALKDDPRVKIIHHGESKGMRAGINAGVAAATGKYVMKIDGHCMVGDGWDEILKADCEHDWVVTPRRKRLDAENWCIQETHKPDIDYMYLSYPDTPDDFGGPGLNGKLWEDKNRDPELKNKEIDDLMSSQGSCWFMHRDYFYELELMDEKSYGPFWNESQEIFLKAWLSGGRCIRNKKTWYAHLHKGKKYGRGYHLPEAWLEQGAGFTQNWMEFGKAWHKQKLPLEWLIQKFWPVPGWPDEWAEKYTKMQNVTESSDSDIPTRPDPESIEMLPEIRHVFEKYQTVSHKPTEIVNQRRDMLADLIHDLGYKIGVEIGVERGRFSQQIMRKNPKIMMFGVDHYGDYPGRFGKNQDANYQEARERLKDYQYTFLTMKSMDALSQFADGSIDFVYIDGDHEFSMVAQDIVEWSKKVRVGGMIAGHDYSIPRHRDRQGNVKNNTTHHVKEAVYGFMMGYRIDPWFVIGREERREGEVRELLRSWFYIKRW